MKRLDLTRLTIDGLIDHAADLYEDLSGTMDLLADETIALSTSERRRALDEVHAISGRLATVERVLAERFAARSRREHEGA